MDITGRLQELLDTYEADNKKLERRIKQLERELEGSLSGWREPREQPNEQMLPVPRLQLTFEPSEEHGWLDYTARYDLIMRHLTGGCLALPLSYTRCRGGRGAPMRDEAHVDLPIRDGAHIMHDAITLGIPAFAVLGNQSWDLSDPWYLDNYRQQIATGQLHRQEGSPNR